MYAYFVHAVRANVQKIANASTDERTPVAARAPVSRVQSASSTPRRSPWLLAKRYWVPDGTVSPSHLASNRGDRLGVVLAISTRETSALAATGV